MRLVLLALTAALLRAQPSYAPPQRRLAESLPGDRRLGQASGWKEVGSHGRRGRGSQWQRVGHRPSGLAIDNNDMLYVSDSQSNDKINPVSKRGIRIGSVKDGMVRAFIPDPEPKGITSTAEGLAVDGRGNVYGAENGSHDIRKYIKK